VIIRVLALNVFATVRAKQDYTDIPSESGAPNMTIYTHSGLWR